MSNKYSKNLYNKLQYDVSILQSRTVNNIMRAIRSGKKHGNLDQVIYYLIELHEDAKVTGVGRKANTVDKKIAKLKELGYKIPKEVK